MIERGRLARRHSRSWLAAGVVGCALLGSSDCVAGADVLAVDEVVAVDTEFAALAGESGLRIAFDHYLAADAVLFRPLPLAGREWLATHEPATGRLEWSPAAARVSCDGSLALTAGLWTYTPPDSRAAETGQYLTAWRRGDDGEWRIVLDQVVTVDPALVGGTGPAVPAGCDGRVTKPQRLESAEKKFNKSLRSRPAAAWNMAPGTVQAESMGTIAGTAGGDLALTYGTIQDARTPADASTESSVRAVYIRIWQRTGSRWQVLLDLVTPLTQ